MTNTPAALKAQRERRQSFVAAGLTIYGTPRKNYRWPELDGLESRARMNERIRICTFIARISKKNVGLDIGIVAVPPAKRSVNVAAWRIRNKILAGEIDQAMAAISAVWCDLPPLARAKCLQLSNTLGTIRRKIA